MSASVAVLRTRPETAVADDGRLMRLVTYDQVPPRDQELAAEAEQDFPEGIKIPTMSVGRNMRHERDLGVADPRDIEIAGDVEAAHVSMGVTMSRRLVIWGDQLIRRGPLRPPQRMRLHSPLMVRAFDATPWGRLFGTS
ncbi:MAG TPA: hypothetical protein VMR23_16145 [Candidatus Limnocylindria bacterium]|nr:hypothetical protein [Candidatus Limnocylindria bacterium]